MRIVLFLISDDETFGWKKKTKNVSIMMIFFALDVLIASILKLKAIFTMFSLQFS